jgi:hypothetical protein
MTTKNQKLTAELRAYIEHLINTGQWVPPEDAQILLKEIDDLNDAVEELRWKPEER